MQNGKPPDTHKTDGELALTVENIGGISRAELTVSPGVTLLAGRNASNKSSLLRALVGILGGPLPPLKSDADRGTVTMTLDGTAYHLDLERSGTDTVVSRSDCFAPSTDLVESFVALTETNPIRQAVLTNGGLYEHLMRPVDTSEIEAEIERLTDKKASLDDRLEELQSMESRLPALQTRRETLREQLADVEASLREKRETIESLESKTNDSNPTRETLRRKRSERNELRTRIETHETAIQELEDELGSVTDQLQEMDLDDSGSSVTDLAGELESLHQQKQRLTSIINTLSPIVETNTQILSDSKDVPDAMKDDDIVAELDPESQSVTCWTCGNTVEREAIADQIETIREIVREKRNERDTVRERIQVVAEQKRDLEDREDALERLRERRAAITGEIERREETLESLESDRQALESDIASLRKQAADNSAPDNRLSECYEEVSDLEYQSGQLTADLERVERELTDLESALDDRETLQSRRESVAEQLREKRACIDELERDLVNTFNETMQRVLDTLAYETIERIWLERRSRNGSETEFDVHIVRATQSGEAYEDTIESLSKSEREVVGLIVALAGYLVHDVSTEIPFIVIDAVEMFDADRIHGLLHHFSQPAEYVLTAVLPEEEAELSDRYETVSTRSLPADS